MPITDACNPAAWSGQGLPPVGVVCEVASRYAHGGDRVRIVAHDDGEAVGRYMSGELIGSYTSFVGGELVPIRTPEQIAAEGRERTIAEMKECFDSVSDELVPTTNKYLTTLFGAMYDAGFRKPKGGDA